MAKIDATLFSQHQQALEQEHCTECAGVLVIKQSKRGPFKCCINYPTCHFTQALTSHDGHIVKNLGIACPKCSNELVLRQGRFGMFIGCSFFPHCQHREKREQPIEQHEDIACPECKSGFLQEKQSRFGKRFYACSGYPKCRFTLNLKPIAGQCEQCGYPLLTEKNLTAGKRVFCANKKCQQPLESC